uniref:Uncharacterized protein n=1 Tax=Oryza sativa subsp. japonica TaxID=39947 RepID=Q69NY5_ORYSJ|nr:hypothetical protein [Oryza sativa Japonica Group]
MHQDDARGVDGVPGLGPDLDGDEARINCSFSSGLGANPQALQPQIDAATSSSPPLEQTLATGELQYEGDSRGETYMGGFEGFGVGKRKRLDGFEGFGVGKRKRRLEGMRRGEGLDGSEEASG